MAPGSSGTVDRVLGCRQRRSKPRCCSLGPLALLLGLACGPPGAIEGTTVRFEPGARFWDAPFPSEHRREGDRIRLSGLPNPAAIEFVFALRRLLESDADGFGLTSPIHLPLDGPIDPASLPDADESVRPDAPVYLLDVDPESPQRGRRHPVIAGFETDPGPFGQANLLTLLPVQGLPLRESTLYAAVVTRSVRDASGAPLGAAANTRRLLEGHPVEGIPEGPYAVAAEALAAEPGEVAGFTVFRTGSPSRGLDRFVAAARAHPVEVGPLEPAEVFPDFCVFEGTAEFPVFQHGRPPYAELGGEFRDGPAGPERFGAATGRVVLTVPRGSAPQDGFPVVLFIRTGGGGDRPLVDRGARGRPGGPALAAGTGPALEFARAGYAGLSWDGPHGGLRNPTRGDEQFLMFNFANPTALRDNIRQTALEAALWADALENLTASSTVCTARLDRRRPALMGHSMGASVAPLAAAVEPRFSAVLLSGAGGSFIENILHKQSPVAVRPIAEILLGYADEGRSVTLFDPVLGLLQWAGEPADTPIYARRFAERDGGPPHVLMMQGIVDTYIPPPVANPLSLAAELDLGGPALEPSLPAALRWSGRAERTLPLIGDPILRAVTQHPEDGVEDGHEVVFQTEGPKNQYRCFLASLRSGAPTLVAPGAPCP